MLVLRVVVVTVVVVTLPLARAGCGGDVRAGRVGAEDYVLVREDDAPRGREVAEEEGAVYFGAEGGVREGEGRGGDGHVL